MSDEFRESRQDVETAIRETGKVDNLSDIPTRATERVYYSTEWANRIMENVFGEEVGESHDSVEMVLSATDKALETNPEFQAEFADFVKEVYGDFDEVSGSDVWTPVEERVEAARDLQAGMLDYLHNQRSVIAKRVRLANKSKKDGLGSNVDKAADEHKLALLDKEIARETATARSLRIGREELRLNMIDNFSLWKAAEEGDRVVYDLPPGYPQRFTEVEKKQAEDRGNQLSDEIRREEEVELDAVGGEEHYRQLGKKVMDGAEGKSVSVMEKNQVGADEIELDTPEAVSHSKNVGEWVAAARLADELRLIVRQGEVRGIAAVYEGSQRLLQPEDMESLFGCRFFTNNLGEVYLDVSANGRGVLRVPMGRNKEEVAEEFGKMTLLGRSLKDVAKVDMR